MSRRCAGVVTCVAAGALREGRHGVGRTSTRRPYGARWPKPSAGANSARTVYAHVHDHHEPTAG